MIKQVTNCGVAICQNFMCLCEEPFLEENMAAIFLGILGNMDLVRKLIWFKLPVYML